MESQTHNAEKGSVYYFAYGSNLDQDQMKKRVGDWQSAERCQLRGYRLVFDKYSTRWKGYVADIIETKEEKDVVYGAIYLISADQLKLLDEHESGYKQVDVVVDAQRNVSAKAYEVIEKEKCAKPPKPYLDAIIKGLVQHGYGSRIISIVKRAALKGLLVC